MADYKKMYTALFNEVTRAIEGLQAAQQMSEEIFIRTDKQPVRVVKPDIEPKPRGDE